MTHDITLLSAFAKDIERGRERGRKGKREREEKKSEVFTRKRVR